MSKAFVKDDDLASPELDIDPLAFEIGGGEGSAKHYITPSGLQKLSQELESLRAQDHAAPSDPTADKAIRRRMWRLESLIQRLEVIDPVTQTGVQARFGATVTVQDEDESERVYRIVGILEADSKAGKVSYLSPIGKALLGARTKDVVVVETPQAEEELKVLKVEYVPIQ